MTTEIDKLLASLRKNWIGYDPLFADMQKNFPKAETYPPYNIVQTGDNSFAIEMAVAGMAENEIEISLEKNILTVRGTPDQVESKDYITKGIASRKFETVYKLGDGIEVRTADMKNGMLIVNLVDMKAKPEKKIIPIGGVSTEGPMLLQE